MFDVIVAGAGVIGAMVARELSRYSLSVCLLEKENDVACGASKANSGIIHAGFDPEPGTLKAAMNVAGVPLLYEAARQLHVPHRNNGSLIVAFGADEEPALHELYERGIQNGVEGLRLLSGDEARALEPALSGEVTLALLASTAGIICPYALTIAAVGNAMDNGVELLRLFDITDVARGDEGFTVTAADGRRVQGRFLVNCAGGGAARIAALAGDGFFTLIPRSGEYLLLDKAEGTRVSHTVFQVPTAAGKGVLVTPTADGNLLVGPTATPVDADDCTETTPEGLASVTSLSRKSVPDVDLRQVITSFCGVRASTKGGDFILQRSNVVHHLVHAAAIDSPGLSSCVAIARHVVALLRDEGLTTSEKADWNGERVNVHAFREMSSDEKNAVIRRDPAYGRIVCRCETVSEGEIRDALRRNPPAWDIDGVKRRTRAGMGRCQGGFCMPLVLKLIAEERGIPEEKVTKNGPGSAPLIGRL